MTVMRVNTAVTVTRTATSITLERTEMQVPGTGGGGGVTDHGLLTGLGDDDHPQYTTTAEAQALVDTHSSDSTAVHGIADTAALAVTASPTFTGSVLMPDGTAANPGVAFSADPDTGFTRATAAGQILDTVVNAVIRTRWYSAGATRIQNGIEATVVDGSGDLQVGLNGAANLGLDGTEIQARSGGAAAQLDLNPHGGAVAVGGTSLAALYQPLDADLTDLAGIADAQGDIIVRGASGWERLAKSATSTDVLTAGASQPGWAAASGGATALGHPLLNLTGGGQPSIGIPGVTISKVDGTAIAISSTFAYYSPMVVEKEITITALEVRVTTASAGAQTARIAIYNAANTWQPGNLITGGDLGTVSTQTTGRKTITGLSVSVPAGIYLVRLHVESTASFEPHNGECSRWSNHHLAQNHPITGTYAALTYAAAESPGTAATAFINGAVGVTSFVAFVWTPT